MPIRTHGQSKTPIYRIWKRMRTRCNNPNTGNDARDYMQRGIKVCKRWDKFENFYSDMGECPPGHSIERINNNRGYSPKNCKWIPLFDQASNTRRSVFITYKGARKTISQWERHLGFNQGVLKRRLLNKWPVKKAIITLPRIRIPKNIRFRSQVRILAEWANYLKINYSVLHARLYTLNWSVKKAFTTPVRNK